MAEWRPPRLRMGDARVRPAMTAAYRYDNSGGGFTDFSTVRHENRPPVPRLVWRALAVSAPRRFALRTTQAINHVAAGARGFRNVHRRAEVSGCTYPAHLERKRVPRVDIGRSVGFFPVLWAIHVSRWWMDKLASRTDGLMKTPLPPDSHSSSRLHTAPTARHSIALHPLRTPSQQCQSGSWNQSPDGMCRALLGCSKTASSPPMAQHQPATSNTAAEAKRTSCWSRSPPILPTILW
jgi:hypothetical protein